MIPFIIFTFLFSIGIYNTIIDKVKNKNPK